MLKLLFIPLPDINTRVFYPGIHAGGCFDSRFNLIIVVC
jgi:hypothetical protein